MFPIPMEFFQSRLGGAAFPFRNSRCNRESRENREKRESKEKDDERANNDQNDANLQNYMLETESAFSDSKPLQVNF